MTYNRQQITDNRSQTHGFEFVVSRKLSAVRLSGFALVEMLVAAAIVGIGIAGIIGAFAAFDRAAGSAVPHEQAILLAQEGIEAALTMRDSGWGTSIATYAAGTPYFLAWESGAWKATTTGSLIESTFYRTVTFGAVYRDGSDRITLSGGTLDNGTRLITSAVSWPARGATSTVTLSAYVSDLFDN